MLFQHLLGTALWTFEESMFCKQTWNWLWEKKLLLHGQETNNPVHGLSQPRLVHTRKRESKERLDLGKKFPESNLPSTQKGHDYGRPTFARVSFFKRIQLLDGYADHLELLPRTKEISILVCMVGRLLAQWTFSEFQIVPRKIPFARPCSSVHIRSTSVNTQA